MKIIPAIDLMDNKVVRLIKGDPKQKTVYSTNPVEIAKKWEKAGADLIHIVDLDATLGIGSNFQTIKKITENISLPVEIAGGLRSREKIENALQIAKKVVLGTIAFRNREVLEEIAKNFGKEKLVISADQLQGKIVVSGWQENTNIDLINGIKQFVDLGYLEFLITSVDRDGTLSGPDLESLKKACDLPSTKIIASGGISSLQDIENVKKCGCFGVILGKALYDGKISIEEVKQVA